MKVRITVRGDSICEGRPMGFSEFKKENGKWSYTWWGADEDELEDWEEEFSSSAEMWERFENFDWSEIMGFDADPKNLFFDYRWNGEIVEDLTDEDEDGTNLAEILDDIHPIFCRSFAELAKEIVVDGGKYITAEEAIEKYGFEKVANAAVEAVRHGYETDVFEKLAEEGDGEDDDINGYKNCIKRLAAEKHSKYFYIDIIEDLASECLYKCFEI